MKKWWLLLVIFSCWIGTGFVVLGRGNGDNQSNKHTSENVRRIVCTAPNLTEILFALGFDEEIVGVTVYSDYPPAASEKRKIGTFWQLNIEAVIAAKPDLVVTLGIEQQKDLADRLKRMGYNCLTVNTNNIKELFEATEIIGATTEKEFEAKKLVEDTKTKLSNLASLVGTGTRVKVLYVVQREPLRVAGRDTFVNEMIELAGGENAIGATLHKYPPIGAEQVIASGAEVIIEPAMQLSLSDQQSGAKQYWSKYKNVPAVKNDRIYVIEAGAVSRLGSRLYEGVETIARCIQPGLFDK